MRIGRRCAFVVAFGGFALAECGPPSPGGHDFEIVVNGNVQFASNVGLESYAWDTQPYNLGSVPTFALETNTVGVNFRDTQEQAGVTFPNNPGCVGGAGTFCPPFTLRKKPELHLFDRNPRDLYFDLMTDPFDNPWASNLAAPTLAGINATPFELPADVVVPYGADFFTDIYPTQISIPSFTAQDFLRAQHVESLGSSFVNGSTTPLSLWNQPSNGGLPKPLKTNSIKAARILTLPECSASLNIQNDVFSQFGSLVNGFDCSQGIQATITAATYLTHLDPNERNLADGRVTPIYPWSSVFGGVMIRGILFVASQLGLEECNVDFTYDLRYALAQPCDPTDPNFAACKKLGTYANRLVDQNGILTLQPIRVSMSAQDNTICGQTLPAIRDLFERQIPSTVYRQAYDRQSLPASPVVDPTNITQFECSPVSTEPIENQCSQAMTLLGAEVSQGATALGLPNANAVSASVHDPRNWTCRYATKDEVTADCSHGDYTGGRCAFQIPATSVVAEPDEVRLAWAPLNDLLSAPIPCTADVDCATTPTQRCGTQVGFCEVAPTSSAFVAAFSGKPTDYQSLCNSPVFVTPTQQYYRRYFATIDAHVCAPGPPPPSPPCPAGLTQCGSNCVNVNFDFNNCGSCSNKCPVGNGLTYGGFACQAGSCVPALTCACSQDSDCAAIMGNGGHCVTGQCVP